jgi:hypothetical protein
MKYLLSIVLILLFACDKTHEDVYCWDCISIVESTFFLSASADFRFIAPSKTTTSNTIRDKSYKEIRVYEKENTDSTRMDDGTLTILIKRQTNCKLQ